MEKTSFFQGLNFTILIFFFIFAQIRVLNTFLNIYFIY